MSNLVYPLESLTLTESPHSTQDYTAEGAPLVTNLEGDKLVFQFSRLPVTGYGQHGPNATIPSPTARRLEAISMIEELAWEHCFQLPGKRGDIAFINNLTVMHARSAFDLDAEGKPLPSKRHLVKLMLQDPELTWGLPGALAGISNRVYGPNRPEGGRDEKWQLTVDSNDDLSGGHVWAGNGGMSNG